jgi:glycerophosphoryl diester phosphodiesterase
MRHTPQVRSLAWILRRPIAHRGLHNELTGVPENTASSFAAALQANYAIECDVQLSADGEAMVFHDGTLDRVMKVTGPIAHKSVIQLKQLSYTVGQDQMQTLPELLAQVRGHVPLIVEIKPHWDGNMTLADRVCDTVANYDGPVALMSFDPDIVAHLAEHAPHVTRGIVADRAHDSYYSVLPIAQRLELRTLAHLGRSQPNFVSFDQAGLPFAPIQQVRAQGFPVITWTITSTEMASRARRYSDQITFEGYLPQ